MSTTLAVIEARGPAPNRNVIEQEKHQQMEALAKIRRMVAWVGSAPPVRSGQAEHPEQAPCWARGLWPEFSYH
ncbi:MAG: hypothetical protein BWX88_04809 [Planctomycetes bacterium ADurb.Bin126]|nr:MAG: hypothetical protein BWX88_04809 [Planctomycetes bacterium ADurb.Bin126]HOD83350.1 hypothetical protein [Phycisphaerae bacterium]HQL76003.1 hypothetical protein [Phycisphaerae bacterium]